MWVDLGICVAADLRISEVMDTPNEVVSITWSVTCWRPTRGLGPRELDVSNAVAPAFAVTRPTSATSAGHLCCLSVSSEHVFEHLGDAVVAGRGREVVGGGNRVWMTA